MTRRLVYPMCLLNVNHCAFAASSSSSSASIFSTAYCSLSLSLCIRMLSAFFAINDGMAYARFGTYVDLLIAPISFRDALIVSPPARELAAGKRFSMCHSSVGLRITIHLNYAAMSSPLDVAFIRFRSPECTCRSRWVA